MNIIAHRGFWKIEEEKNTLKSFERAIDCGFGIETDIRDCCGKLVIAHDMPNGNEIGVEEFFSLNGVQNIPLALNIKSDGLQNILWGLIKKYDITNYFVFDMSIPDTINYLNAHYTIALRESEYEPMGSFHKKVTHVWLDCFNPDWLDTDLIQAHLNNGKKVCVVSSELHKRDYKATWQMLKEIDNENLMLCTDYPQKAREYFNE